MAELADAPDLGSGAFGRRGSNPLLRTKFISFKYGSLAQLAEHLTLNQRVTGSSPVRSTKFSKFKASKHSVYIIHGIRFGAFFV